MGAKNPFQKKKIWPPEVTRINKRKALFFFPDFLVKEKIMFFSPQF